MVHLKSIWKQWSGSFAIRDLNLEIHSGEYVAVVGPSGCGKTTLLRMLAGFDEPDQGEIWLADYCANDPTVLRAPHGRSIGMVFQNLALWPHLTVQQHLSYVLHSFVPKVDMRSEIDRLLSLVSLQSRRNSYPGQLSGGEQQRVALIRAIARSPKILLLDEPMNSLDRNSRKELSLHLRELHVRTNLTVLHVTHDWRDILGLAQRVVELDSGVVARTVTAETYFVEKRQEEFVL